MPPSPSPRIYATCNIGDDALDRLVKRGYLLEVHQSPEAPAHADVVEKVCSGVDALITTLRDRIDRQVFEAGEGTLRIVAQDAVGYDNIDIQAASEHRIPVAHTPDVLTDATAEFALFMMGCAARRTYPSEQLVRRLEWGPWHPSRPFLGDQVTGKTLGIIGLGRIGKSLALKASGLEMNILAYTRTPDATFARRIARINHLRREMGLGKHPGGFRHLSFEDCLSRSDFVSLHLPLTDQTRGIIDERALARMKKTAFLINTSRGPVVDESALWRALKSGLIAGAALDVYAVEPLPDDSPLRDPDLEGCLRLFHHFGSGTRETRLSPDPQVGMAGRCVQAVIDVLDGHYGGDPSQMPFVVNKEVF